MEELKIDKAKVLEAMKECPEFARVAKKLWEKELEVEQKFEIGDIVRIRVLSEFGIIKTFDNDNRLIGVELFQADSGRNDLKGKAYPGHGWWFNPEFLELVYRPKK